MPRSTLFFLVSGLAGLLIAMALPFLGAPTDAGLMAAQTAKVTLIPLGYGLMILGALGASVDFLYRRATAPALTR